MRKEKTIILVLSFSTFVLLTPPTASARELEGLKTTIKQERKELRTDFKEKIKEVKDDLKVKLDNIKGQMAKIAGGEITSISGSTLSVTSDGKTYTVNTDAGTHFQRHFWGKSNLEEIAVGNKVNVHGKFTDEDKTIIQARMIRNLSIMKRFGVFMGDVTAKNADNFVIDSKQRGEQTVFFNTTTKFVNRNQTTSTYADLQVGHRVRIKGLWDKSLNKITDVVQVKNYNLPPKPTKANISVTIGPSPTAAPTLAVTLTPTLTLTPTP